MKKVTPSRLSVYESEVRTNNNCESYHSQLRKKFGVHPAFWSFLRLLDNLLATNDIDLNRVESGVQVRRVRKKVIAKANQKRLDSLKEKLNSNKITPLQFVHFVAKIQTSKIKCDFQLNDPSFISLGDFLSKKRLLIPIRMLLMKLKTVLGYVPGVDVSVSCSPSLRV